MGGNDLLFGGAGGDILFEGAGDDAMNGGADYDMVSFADSFGPINVDLDAGTATGDGSDTLASIEGVYGSEFDDTILGDAKNNNLYGDDGSDDIEGAAGRDYLNGGDGNDSLLGGSNSDRLKGAINNDYLHGQTGNDKLYGDEGNDTLRGGLDADFMSGGTGNDLYTYRIEEGDDVIANASSRAADTDRLAMLGISYEQVSIDLVGADAVITVYDIGTFNIRGTVTIQSWFTAAGAKLDTVSFIDVTLSSNQIDDILT